MTEGAVSHWLTKAKTQGVHALRHQPPPGRPSTVTDEPSAQLPAVLAKGADAFGVRGDVWTTARVAAMIQQEFGVSSHPAHGRRLLRHVGDSLHKPIHKVTQRKDAAIHAGIGRAPNKAEAEQRPIVCVDASAW